MNSDWQYVTTTVRLEAVAAAEAPLAEADPTRITWMS